MIHLGFVSTYVPLGAATVVLLVVIIHQRLRVAAQPLRLQLAEIGAQLNAGHLSKEDRENVEFALAHAFGMWRQLLMSSILIPFEAIRIIVDRRVYREWQSDRNCPPQIKTLLSELTDIMIRITFFNHPFLLALVVVELVVLIGIAIVIGTAFHGEVPSVGLRTIFSSLLWNHGRPSTAHV